MKLYSKIIVGALLAAFVMFSSSPSHASCTIYGKIVRIHTNVSAATPFSYVYVIQQTTSLRTNGHYFYVGPDEAAALATITAAAAANQKVRVIGNASACATSGTWRYGGLLTSINLFSFY